MQKTTILLIIISLLFSCKPNYKDKILGEWRFAGVAFRGHYNNDNLYQKHLGNVGNYTFYENNICQERRGLDVLRGFFNDSTQYKLIGDSLSILNVADKYWKKLKILNISADSLFVSGEYSNHDSIYYVYVRPVKKVYQTIDFDEIVFSYGAWSKRTMLSINKNGEIIFCDNVLAHTKKYLSGKMQSTQFKKLQDGFEKAMVMGLQERYEDSSADVMSVKLVLIKGKRVIKTITDVDASAPPELIWAYAPILYLDYKIKMDTLKNADIIGKWERANL